MFFTACLGFTPNSDEGKVEALASYGSKNNKLYDYLIKSTMVSKDNQIIIDENIIDFLKRIFQSLN